MTSAILAPEQYVALAEEMRAEAIRNTAARTGQVISRTVDWAVSQPHSTSAFAVLAVAVAATSLVVLGA